MNLDAVERGRSEAPYAFVVPFDQPLDGHDIRLVEILQSGGVEVERSDAETALRRPGRSRAGGGSCGWPSHSVRSSRRCSARRSTRGIYRDGEPVRPYDVTAWRLSAMLGVDVYPVLDPSALERI